MVLFEKAPAKINLTLDVLGKRDDGYHNVEMIMTTIDLADRIELISLEKDEVQVYLESRYVPCDERNLAYQAAMIFKEKYKIAQGVRIHIDKSIPVSAGLGGGSTDAAAVLRGLNRLWSLNIPIEELANLGGALGSDVPFSVHGGTAIARGFGEEIEQLPSPPPCWVILAKPNIGVSTRTIFEKVNVDNLTHPDTEKVLQALQEQDFDKLCDSIGNSLEQITIDEHAEVVHIKEVMKQVGIRGVLMSGSGPTVYGLVEQHRKAVSVYNAMRGFCEEVYLVRLLG